MKSVEVASALLWEEHCVECAVPECYAVCPLYVRRRDGKCARLEHGIYPNPAFQGLYEYGADLRFRRWGRLEAVLLPAAGTPSLLRRLSRMDRAALSILNPLATALEPIDRKRKLNGLYRAAFSAGLSRARWGLADKAARFDAFVVEAYNPGDAAVRLIVEIIQDRASSGAMPPERRPVFRGSLLLEPGQNFHRIRKEDMAGDLGGRGRILVYPENDAEVRLVFTWLDFVQFKSPWSEAPARAAPPVREAPEGPPVPASKVKCVAWDLDNTIWNGTLIEAAPERLSLRPGVVETIRQLDARGILNTVVSKNDMDQAWSTLTGLGLSEYFVSPAINWGPKSANIKAVAEALNIGVDTFALVDDSPFERGEVESALPQVRVFPETAIPALVDRPEFDVPITAESKHRRLSYRAEDQRRAIAATFGSRYEDFLRSCELRLELFRPATPEELQRVLELIQRSNQLNLSSRRCTREELLALLADPDVLSLAWRCRDRYGDYGIVGFSSVSTSGPCPVIRDLVVSCRVANKLVENAFFQWLAGWLAGRGDSRLEAWFTATARNHVLLDSLEKIGFAAIEQRGATRVLQLELGGALPGGSIVQVDAATLPVAGAMSGSA